MKIKNRIKQQIGFYSETRAVYSLHVNVLCFSLSFMTHLSFSRYTLSKIYLIFIPQDISRVDLKGEEKMSL